MRILGSVIDAPVVDVVGIAEGLLDSSDYCWVLFTDEPKRKAPLRERTGDSLTFVYVHDEKRGRFFIGCEYREKKYLLREYGHIENIGDELLLTITKSPTV